MKKQEMKNRAKEICAELSDTWEKYSEWFGENEPVTEDAWKEYTHTCQAYAKLFDCRISEFMFIA